MTGLSVWLKRIVYFVNGHWLTVFLLYLINKQTAIFYLCSSFSQHIMLEWFSWVLILLSRSISSIPNKISLIFFYTRIKIFAHHKMLSWWNVRFYCLFGFECRAAQEHTHIQYIFIDNDIPYHEMPIIFSSIVPLMR